MSTSTYALFERKGHWLTGVLGAFRDNRLAFLAESAQLAPIVKFRLGHRRVYLVSHPDLIRDLLVTQQRHLARDPLVRKILEKTLGVGLLTSEGEEWKRHRRMIAPALHLQQVRGYTDIMVRQARALTECWQDGQEADVEQEMDGLTLSIVTAALFRVDSAAHAETIAATVPALQAIATRQFDRLIQVPDWLPTPEHRRQRALCDDLNRIVLGAIRQRRASGAEGDDLLTMMVHRTDPETGARMSDEEIRAEVLTLYLAGYDTTALTLTYVWYQLARQPEIAARFHEEIDTVLGGRAPGFDDLERLPYTRMVFKEALRLYPPAYFIVRAVAEPLELGGHPIPVNSVLMMSAYAMHRHPDLWEDPERFDPERFAKDAESGWHKFKYFPFGGGPHICIGNQFALVEGPLILATIGQRYRFELRHPSQQLELEPQITLGPKGGMPLRLHRRTPPGYQCR
ncbi:cytochrome P450 [uncultured Thiodictyon sp.]|uniref:cytochrome P450 n=1 Tax=uncultured Thiodictyon sp. TaxID=1846217 RepID=UPI0025E0B1C4|nr:cytochrome P450 [uncultured Thiodictyon sp.]